MAAPRLLDPFHRRLYTDLTEELSGRIEQLAMGGATNFEDYCLQAGYNRALKAVLGRCEQIELDMYGPQKSDEQS